MDVFFGWKIQWWFFIEGNQLKLSRKGKACPIVYFRFFPEKFVEPSDNTDITQDISI